jgi:hypothetical protein
MFVGLCSFVASAAPTAPAVVTASANRERKGTYFVRSGIESYDFWVRVPSSYSATNPAGLLVFLHGAGGPTPPEKQGKEYLPTAWDQGLCEKFNLICLHASYADGMQSDDLQRKVDAAKKVIAQTMADYKIIAGRGILSAFSNGGRPEKELWHQLSENYTGAFPGVGFPFCTIAQYSTVPVSRRLEVPVSPAISWFSYVGEHEWAFERIGVDDLPLYVTQAKRVLQGAALDLNFTVRPGITHDMPNEEMVVLAAESFERADTFFAPFVYAPDFVGKDVMAAVLALSKMELGAAAKLLTNLRSAESEKLRSLLEKRVDKVLASLGQLSKSDPALAVRLGRIVAKQFAGHPREAALLSLIESTKANPSNQDAIAADNEWLSNVGNFVEDAPRIVPANFNAVAALAKRMPSQSVNARVVSRFLELKAGAMAAYDTVPNPHAVSYVDLVQLDADPREWKKVRPLEAPFSKAKKSFVRMGWNQNGLFGFVEFPSTANPTPGAKKNTAPWFQLFVEKDARRAFALHENAAEYQFRFDPSKPNHDCVVTSAKSIFTPSEPSQFACRWSQMKDGDNTVRYSLEFSVGASELAPFTLAAKSVMGMNFSVNAPDEPLQQFWSSKREHHGYATPRRWGAVRLAGH